MNVLKETIRLKNSDVTLTVDQATVIHANKYSKADGAVSHLVISTLHTELVFRISGTGEDLRTDTKHIDLPVYTGQEVLLIRVANIIVAYVDRKSNHYHYLSNDIGRKLGLGIPFYWLWPIGIAGVVLAILMKELILAFAPLAMAWLFFLLQRLYYNLVIKKEIDRVISKQ
jgi:hypothetical protein